MDGHLNSKSTAVKSNDLHSIFRDFIFRNKKARPPKALPIHDVDLEAWQSLGEDSVIWFGHSAYLLQLAGKVLFVDPMLANSYIPFLEIGGKRFNKHIPFHEEQLDQIDIVLITHNHYDHLNKKSIRRLMSKVRTFIVPTGVSALLIKWGVAPERILELATWESVDVEGITISGTPTKHFSGRGLTDRNRTLWLSYVIEAGHRKIYCGGDSGYGPHFKAIGERFGPFDLTVLECGQYDNRWTDVHMRPEETVQAHLDLRGNRLLPVHWGGFQLAFHDWDDPIKRVVKAATQNHVKLATPHIGEPVSLEHDHLPTKAWWEHINHNIH